MGRRRVTPYPDNVRRLMRGLAVSDINGLAQALGTTEANVRNWVKRGHIPVQWFERAESITNTSAEWFISGHGDPPPATSKPVPRYTWKVEDDAGRPAPRANLSAVDSLPAELLQEFVLVPCFAARASAGPGAANGPETDLASAHIAFRRDWMRSELGRAGDGFASLQVSGSSMEPTLWDGQSVIVDLQWTGIGNGGVFVLRDGDELLVKRLQPVVGGTVEVISDNPVYGGRVERSREQLSVVGRVVWPRVR